MAKRFSAEQKTEHYGLWSSCFLGTQRVVPLEHMEQLLPSALPGAQSSSSGTLWRVRAHMAALLGAHIQQISFSEHVQLLHRSTWIELLLPRRTQSSSAGARGAAAHWQQIQQLHWSIMSSCFPEHSEQLCWSVSSSGCLGADTVAPLEHMEQRLPRSTDSSSAGARGAAVL